MSAPRTITLPIQAGTEDNHLRGMAAADALAMDMLASHIPLTLMLDLAESFGPPSAQILESETDRNELGWLLAVS